MTELERLSDIDRRLKIVEDAVKAILKASNPYLTNDEVKSETSVTAVVTDETVYKD